VQAGTITTLLTGVGGVESVTNERPAVGGRDEETQAELEERAPATLRRGNRAVTVGDFAALAASAGGIARATALGNRHPDHPEISVPGAVTVVVVPDTKEVPPRPSPDQIEEVERHLEEFRLLTTELYVRPPRFLPVSVEARVAIRRYASEATVQRAVAEALDRVLSPLGSNGGGRDFGLDLYPTSLLAVALAVEDVVAVARMTVSVDGRPYDLDERVDVPPDGLLYGVGHVIVAEPYREEDT
jgi:predicted phage baseplate assembly protein